MTLDDVLSYRVRGDSPRRTLSSALAPPGIGEQRGPCVLGVKITDVSS